MAKLTITLEAVIDGAPATVTKAAEIPDDAFPDYISGHAVKHALIYGKTQPTDRQVVDAHLTAIIKEAEQQLNGAIYRRKFNAEFLKHVPIKLS